MKSKEIDINESEKSVHLKFLACLALFLSFVIYMDYTGVRYQNHIKELVSPLMHPEADISSLTQLENKDEYISIYRVNDDGILYVENSKTYFSSKILNMIEKKTFGKTSGTRGGSTYFNTRMLTFNMGSSNNCIDHLKNYSLLLSGALSSKSWVLDFEIKKNDTNPQITSIKHTSFFNYQVPRLFLFCDNESFVFISSSSRYGYSDLKIIKYF